MQGGKGRSGGRGGGVYSRKREGEKQGGIQEKSSMEGCKGKEHKTLDKWEKMRK